MEIKLTLFIIFILFFVGFIGVYLTIFKILRDKKRTKECLLRQKTYVPFGGITPYCKEKNKVYWYEY